VTAGLAAAHANALLGLYRGTSVTGITVYIKLHTGDPGLAGTANASANTTRQAASFSAPAGGSMSLSAAPASWSMTAPESLTHVSLWDAPTGGNFIRSMPLVSSKSVISGDTYVQNTLTMAYTPLAA
jgi:hypothetical protein